MTVARTRTIATLPAAQSLDGSEVIPGVKNGITFGLTADALAGLAAGKVPPGGATKQSVGLGNVEDLSPAQLASPGNAVGDRVKGTFANGRFRVEPDAFKLADGSSAALSEQDAVQFLAKTPTQPNGSFRGREYNVRVAPKGRPNWAFSGDHVLVIDRGAEINGPQSAGYGRTTMWFKEGYPSITAPYGEGDLLLLLGQQCGPTATSIDNCSDLDGIQGNLRISGDCGFVAGVELNVGRIDPVTFEDTNKVTATIAVYDPFGKNQEQGLKRYVSPNPLSFGVYAGADKGKCDRAYYAANGAEGYWDWLLYLKGPSGPVHRVKGGLGQDAGTIFLGSDVAGYTIGINEDGNLQVSTTLGAAIIISQNKVVSFDSAIACASLSVTGQETLTARNTLTLPHLSIAPANPSYLEIANFGGKAQQWDGAVWRALW